MSKLPTVRTSIFSVMSKLAVEHSAINLSQGFPNFPIDPVLKNMLKECIDSEVHQYPPMAGNLELLEQISRLIELNYARKISPATDVLVTAGATQAIFTAIQAFVNHGDEAVVFDPCYDCYNPAIILAGGKPIHISLNHDYLPDWELIERTVTFQTKLLIINNPHNPSGKIWAKADFESLECLLEKFPQLIIISDEVYEYITFEQKHISVNSIPTIADRSIIISSFGKTFHITGWKVGYMVAPAKFMNELKMVHQYMVFSVNSVAQAAIAKYLSIVDVQLLGAFYQKKRNLFVELMKKSNFQMLPSEGTYFQLADYSKVSELSDLEFTKELVVKHGVAAIPVSVFSKEPKNVKHIRFCFAKTDETLINAAAILCKI